jgi:thiosulfate dehydrogenase
MRTTERSRIAPVRGGTFFRALSTALLVLVVSGCRDEPIADESKRPAVASADSALPVVPGQGGPRFIETVTTTVAGQAWHPPAEADIPPDSLGQAIRRGLTLLRHLPDSLPNYASGHISCTNCHLQDGRSRYASPLVGSYARYPKYIQRSAAVVTMADRINFCITRSLAGNRLPTDSREMTDMIAYIAWLSKGLPFGANTPGGEGLPTLKPPSNPDPTRGATLYASKCQSCHQADGGGAAATGGSTVTIPALWGAHSYSVGASMARVERAASFIAHNMPLGLAGTLTTQDAFDVAAYVNSHARPDLPMKELDWAAGGAPADLPYDTKSGHRAVNPPPLLPRKTPARTLVPAPPRAGAIP